MEEAIREQGSVEIIRDPTRVLAALKPLRRKLLEHLEKPDSAAGLSRRLGLPRQRLNHHLRELESQGLVRFVEERRRGNCLERLLQSSSRHYLISPEVMGRLGATDPESVGDRFSWSHLINILGRALRDLGTLRRGADREGKRLATFSLQTEVRFESAGARSAFVEELTAELSRLVSKYHNASSQRGRRFEFFAGSYAAVIRPEDQADSEKERNGSNPHPGL